MSELTMEKLFRLASQLDCDELEIVVGNPVSVLIGEQVVHFGTSCVAPEDTVRLMKDVTPEEYRKRLAEDGSFEFGCVDAKGDRFHLMLTEDRDAIRMTVRRTV